MPTLTEGPPLERKGADGPPMPPIDPRIRARLLSVQHAAARRRQRWIIAAGSVVAVAAAAVGVTRSPLLAVDHVRVNGGTHTTQAAVLAATGLARKPLMIDLGLARLRAELQALPWVATARITRHWPSTVNINLTERVPVATAASAGGGAALLDQGGRVLATVGLDPGSVAPAIPTISGLAPVGAPGSSVPKAAGVSDALVLAAGLPGVEAAFPLQIKGIVIANGSLDLTLSGGATVSFGTADDLGDKLVALQTVLQRVDLKGIATIDLRLPGAPVLTHATRGGTVSTIPRG